MKYNDFFMILQYACIATFINALFMMCCDIPEELLTTVMRLSSYSCIVYLLAILAYVIMILRNTPEYRCKAETNMIDIHFLQLSGFLLSSTFSLLWMIILTTIDTVWETDSALYLPLMCMSFVVIFAIISLLLAKDPWFRPTGEIA